MPDQQQLQGKVAIVTGGSSGIGAAAVRMLAEKAQASSSATTTAWSARRKIIAELPGDGHRAMQIELEDSATMRRAADEVRGAYGRADILVNSAGFTKPVPHGNLEALDDALFDSHADRQCARTIRDDPRVRAAAARSGEGVVVNVSSIAGFTGSGSSIAYCGAKAALDNMTIALARVLGPQIRCCASRLARSTPISSPAAIVPNSRSSLRQRRSNVWSSLRM